MARLAIRAISPITIFSRIRSRSVPTATRHHCLLSYWGKSPDEAPSRQSGKFLGLEPHSPFMLPILMMLAAPTAAQTSSPMTLPQSVLHTPDMISPAVLPYLACLYGIHVHDVVVWAPIPKKWFTPKPERPRKCHRPAVRPSRGRRPRPSPGSKVPCPTCG